MGIFLDYFMPGTADSPCVVTLSLPDGTEFRALTTSDITVSLGNKFGSLIPDTTALSDISQMFNNTNVAGWIGASTQVWKATQPVSLSLELYLINYKAGLGYREKLKSLAKLAAVAPSDYSIGQSVTYKVHGGYAPDVFLDNNKQINWSSSGLASQINNGSILSNMTKGTITMKVGSKFKLRNLVLTKLDIQQSIVEVYNPNYGGEPEPLYYRLNVSLMTNKCAVSTDVDSMLGG